MSMHPRNEATARAAMVPAMPKRPKPKSERAPTGDPPRPEPRCAGRSPLCSGEARSRTAATDADGWHDWPAAELGEVVP